jgi:SNF2 family DNA or RNA helicase
VSRFLEDPAISVIFLHSLGHAAGLTLVNAADVFLIEPLLNPMIEMQAVTRVHRIGQTRETTVHQYIVAGEDLSLFFFFFFFAVTCMWREHPLLNGHKCT